MSPSKASEGPVVLVTGGTSGIGEATAASFASGGARVVICGRDAARGTAVAAEIARRGGSCQFVAADVSQADEVAELFAAVAERYGRLDCAFNAAGGEARVAPLTEQEDRHFEEMLAIDLRGTWLCMKQELRMMLDQGEGAIVNCSAVAGLRGSPGASAYAACKHGILGLTRSAALEWAQHGIRVNAVCPGIVETPGLDRTFSQVPGLSLEEAKRWGLEQVPMKRFARADEVAQAVAWLCSQAASYVTGHALVIDAGTHCR